MMVASIRKAGGYARRIEDKYGVGILDTILVPKGYPVFFAEVKKIKGNVFRPTDRQFIEMKRINEIGGMHMFGILIGFKDDVVYFHEATNYAEIKDCFSVTTSDMTFHDQLIQFYHGRLKA
jgi:hypothetical protein